MTKTAQPSPLPAWSLLLSRRQDCSDNFLTQIPITPNQQGRHEMMDEVISIVSPQDIDTSRYQVSDLDNKHSYWEKI